MMLRILLIFFSLIFNGLAKDLSIENTCRNSVEFLFYSCESRSPEKNGTIDSCINGNEIERDCLKIFYEKSFISLSHRTELIEVLTKTDKIEKFSMFQSPFVKLRVTKDEFSHNLESKNPEKNVVMDSRARWNYIEWDVSYGSSYPKINYYQQDFLSDTFSVSKRKYIFKINHLEPVQTIKFNPPKQKINYIKLGLITTGAAASVAVLHHYQSKAWWQATRRDHFHFQNDWEYALWIDKLGHWWGATAIQHIFSSSLSWANFSDESSVILGSLLALTYQLYVETYDGYAQNWGFSPGDALFDFGGAIYPLIQYYYPTLKNINLKLSYYPSKRLLKKNPNDTLYQNKFVIDDYEGQSFYLSFKINNMLPESLEKYWPDFLCIAVGYQIRNWNGYASADKNFFIALDYDLEKIPLYGNFWQFLKRTFNLFHLPAPAIKISNKKISFTIAY